jgi:hypothetical protein
VFVRERGRLSAVSVNASIGGLTSALSVNKATEALCTPGISSTSLSIAATQAPHDIPLTSKSVLSIIMI